MRITENRKNNKIAIMILVVMCVIITIPIVIKMYNSFSSALNGSSVFEYTVNSDKTTCTITGLVSGVEQENIEIPSEIKKYTVTAIAQSAFEGSKIKTVIIPSTVKSIGKRAFANCKSLYAVYGLENCTEIMQIQNETFLCCNSLEYLKLPPNIVYIGEKAFIECSSIEIFEFPANLKTIDYAAFLGCSALSKLNFPQGLKKIETSFGNCYSLIEVTIPSSVEKLSSGAFMGCRGLKNIYVDDDNNYFISIDGIIYDKNKEMLWIYPSGKIENHFDISNKIRVLADCSFAFNNNIESINISQSVTRLGKQIFWGSKNLKTINYTGTVQQWFDIVKDNDWNYESSDFIVFCTNGQIEKDGTVTYK